jgi:predicted alpha/beta-fold hydrolase
VNEIKTKTFILAAYDDPFIDIQDYLRANWNKNVHLCFQKKGGHMGYYAKKKNPNYGHRWLDHYLGSVFEKIQSF